MHLPLFTVHKEAPMRRMLLLAMLAAMAVLGTAVARAGGVQGPIPIRTEGEGDDCKIIVSTFAQRHPGAVVWKSYADSTATITFNYAPGALPAPVSIVPPPVPKVGVAILTDIGFYKYTVTVDGCGEVDPWLDIG
jgi:hypothetical protein